MGTCRILSRSDELFHNRVEAGQLLAQAVITVHPVRPVVLGIPRGGVIVARELAHALDAPLDIVVARKLGAPGNPELAIGAVSEDGRLFLDEQVARAVGADRAYIEEERECQMREIARRAALYRHMRAKVPLQGRTAIVTDDGVATGATTQAALRAVRQEQPARLVLAVPVGPEHTLEGLAKDADEVLCLRAPAFFAAVGQFYECFTQTEEEELLAILREEAARAGGAGRA